MSVLLSRRHAVWLGLGGLAASVLPGMVLAASVDDLTAAFAKGATPGTQGITLTIPPIAENGFAVPVGIEAPGAVAVMLLALGNPVPAVATFTFGPAAARQRAATRIRLARSQDVAAWARMADGSVTRTQVRVAVTIGGCGA